MDISEFSDRMLGKRYQPKVREALRLVLVDGKGQTEAANIVGIKKQQVNRAIKALLALNENNT